MIIDHLSRSQLYLTLHPYFELAFSFLKQKAHLPLALRKIEIQGDDVLAISDKLQGKGHLEAKLEAHQTYIDLQYVVSGDEEIGFKPRELCTKMCSKASPYDPLKDIEFFSDEPTSWIRLPPGYFALLFPEDAHAPLAGSGPLEKIVIKIKTRPSI